ncbi:tryptophan--tRNA ligase [Actinomadura syzygii]|uniref:tryptophan--tRNA ligase n=1 Tax=Actinomadura syzygii TaxID=1427538 RepID=UPI001CA3052D|nr:tryptophan--tRNA ligase [Actinomadura syzygii]
MSGQREPVRIFSGIQPTGRKHLGNFLGGVQQFVEGQHRGDAVYCIVNMHATTIAYAPEALRERVYDTQALLIAAGVDPDKCVLFRQSDVAEHGVLCWLLSSVTAYGELGRMHQFKEKSVQQRDLVSTGLFLYPVLQAADILLYQAQEVPVGEDQRQHLELTRNLAQRFNARFGETFTVPRIRVPKTAARVMDLQDPTAKMSTSARGDAGTVHVLDDPDTIAQKVRSAMTDSGREVRLSPEKPGISNLIEIYAGIPAVDRRGRGAIRPNDLWPIQERRL